MSDAKVFTALMQARPEQLSTITPEAALPGAVRQLCERWHRDSRIRNNLNWVMGLFSGALTPLIAITAAYIAWQQYRLNDTRLRLESYDRRLKVFQAVMAFVGSVLAKAATNFEAVVEFYRHTAEADFLFGRDVRHAIDELYQKGVKLAELYERLYPSDGSPGLPVGENRTDVASHQSELVAWFSEQSGNVKSLFKHYLSVS